MALSRERKVLQSRRELLRIPWHLQREMSKTIYALAESAQEAKRLPRSVPCGNVRVRSVGVRLRPFRFCSLALNIDVDELGDYADY